MADIGFYVVEDVAGVRDNEAGLGAVNHVLIFFQQTCRSVSEQCHVLDINTALRLVQHDERGALHHELEDFAAFDLAAGESGIDITIEELCHMHAFRQ